MTISMSHAVRAANRIYDNLYESDLMAQRLKHEKEVLIEDIQNLLKVGIYPCFDKTDKIIEAKSIKDKEKRLIKIDSVFRSNIDMLYPRIDRLLRNYNQKFANAKLQLLVKDKINTIGDITKDILALNVMYEDKTSIDLRANIIEVITDPITLSYNNKDWEFGEFKIIYRYLLPSSEPHLRFVALEPLWAREDSESGCSHPHIQDNYLCMGDAEEGILSSMKTGNVYNLFQILNSVLTTYNPRSPYISLENWYGIPCSSCGRTSSIEDTYNCSNCDDTFCDECIYSCNDCGANLCSECYYTCNDCGDIYCKECIDDNGLCYDCREKECSFCNEMISKDEWVDHVISCNNCGNITCINVQTECSCCGKNICKSCSTTCWGCHDVVCTDCIVICDATETEAATRLCEHCIEEKENRIESE